MILPYATIVMVVVWLLLRRGQAAPLGSGPCVFGRGHAMAVVAVVALFVVQAVAIVYSPGETRWQISLLLLSQVGLAALSWYSRRPGSRVPRPVPATSSCRP